MWYDVEYNTSFAKLLGINSTVSTMVEIPDCIEPNDVIICYYLGLTEIPDGLKYEVSPYQE